MPVEIEKILPILALSVPFCMVLGVIFGSYTYREESPLSENEYLKRSAKVGAGAGAIIPFIAFIAPNL